MHIKNGDSQFKEVLLSQTGQAWQRLESQPVVLHPHRGAQRWQYIFKSIKQLQCYVAIPREDRRRFHPINEPKCIEYSTLRETNFFCAQQHKNLFRRVRRQHLRKIE